MIRIHQKKKPEAEDGGEREICATRLDAEGEDRPKPQRAAKKPQDEQKRPEVLSSAYRILQSGANSRKMLREKLVKKGFSVEEANEAIALCEAQGFLSEKKLFLAHAAYLAEKKRFGRRRIRLELMKKFDHASVNAYFDEALEEIDFEALAKAEAKRCAARGKRYTLSRLSSLGYSSHEIYEALEGLSFEDEEI